MLFFQHLLIAIGLGAIILVCIEVSQRTENYSLHRIYALFIGLISGQLVDIDHYKDSINTLVRCGVSSCNSDFIGNGVCVELHRGIFHNPYVFVTLLTLTGAAAIWAYKKDKKVLSTLLCGFFIGYIAHWAADGLIPGLPITGQG